MVYPADRYFRSRPDTLDFCTDLKEFENVQKWAVLQSLKARKSPKIRPPRLTTRKMMIPILLTVRLCRRIALDDLKISASQP